MKLWFFHTPELVPTDGTPDCAIAIDVLRATSTIATALHAGAEAVQAFSDLDELRRVSDTWPADQRLRAGERGGQQVEGFDLGNSPLDCTPERFGGKRLFISTTNGTRALQQIRHGRTVHTAALINRQAVVDSLVRQQPETVWIVGSGWEGSYALEDTVCAGAIAQGILDATGAEIGSILGNDELLGALSLFRQWQHDLLGLLRHASHGQRLLRLNITADIDYCSQLDKLDVLPTQTEPGVLKLV